MPRRMWLCNECPTCHPYPFGRHADQGEFCPGQAAEVIVTWVDGDESRTAVPITLGPDQTIIGHFLPVYPLGEATEPEPPVPESMPGWPDAPPYPADDLF